MTGSEPIQYREAQPSDISQLVQLRMDMQRAVTRGRISVPPAFLREVRAFFEARLGSPSLLLVVATRGEEIVSNAGAIVYEKIPSLTNLCGKVGYVTNVYTKEDSRRMGIGTRVIESLVDLARKRDLSKLHLGYTEEGFGLYQKAGFERVSNHLQIRLQGRRR